MANFAAPTLSVGGKALGSHATASAGKGGAWQLVQGVDCVAADETGSGDGGRGFAQAVASKVMEELLDDQKKGCLARASPASNEQDIGKVWWERFRVAGVALGHVVLEPEACKD